MAVEVKSYQFKVQRCLYLHAITYKMPVVESCVYLHVTICMMSVATKNVYFVILNKRYSTSLSNENLKNPKWPPGGLTMANGVLKVVHP